LTIECYQILQSQLISLCDIRLPNEPKGFAAVLVPLYFANNEWHVVLTLRASHLRHHSGEVAFPGGMWEEGDASPMITALRESHEEIALPHDEVELIGGLNALNTRRLAGIRPIVGVIPDTSSLKANKDETESIFTVPLSFFLEDQRLRTDIFMQQSQEQDPEYWVPAYQYKEYEIWGFTASVIVQLLNRCFSANIQRSNNAPEKIW
jgi:8-oxo-dGTP pyrophosphatase MutT (NUDIX family)